MLKHRRLFILCGVPGCGKSTWARAFKASHDHTEIVSRDALRFAYLDTFGGEYFDHEDVVFREYVAAIQQALDNHEIKYVIADATHINFSSRMKLLNNLVITWDIDVIPIVFISSLRECKIHNNLRSGRERVPDKVIEAMDRHFTMPNKCEYNYDDCYIVEDAVKGVMKPAILNSF